MPEQSFPNMRTELVMMMRIVDHPIASFNQTNALAHRLLLAGTGTFPVEGFTTDAEWYVKGIHFNVLEDGIITRYGKKAGSLFRTICGIQANEAERILHGS